jgi:hypothetical protein
MTTKDYLLGLLDGSSSLSHEGIGLVIQKLRFLEKAVEAAKDLANLSPISYEPFERALAALEEDV